MYSGHDAGVTAILPLRPGILLTGSYDDHVRVYPTFKGLRPQPLAQLHIGGGVWRLKLIQRYTQSPDPADLDAVFKYSILASCMHAGARVLEVECKAGDWKISVEGEVTIHKSMCYGSDVQPVGADPAEGKKESRICVSTSFYDIDLEPHFYYWGYAFPLHYGMFSPFHYVNFLFHGKSILMRSFL